MNTAFRYPPQPFDELQLGMRFVSGPRRVEHADIARFAELSGDLTALHTDAAYAASTPLGGLVAHGALNLSIATGLAYELGIFEGLVLAFRGLSVKYERPVRPGDELTLALTVAERDPSPRPDRGRVGLDAELLNQAQKRVLSGRWELLIRREPTP